MKNMVKKVLAVNMGSEPDATLINASNDDYKIVLASTFNWYNLEKERKDARKYLVDFAKKQGVDITSASDSDITLTYGWVARIVSRGAVLSDDHMEKLSKHVKKIYARTQKIVIAPQQSNKISIQEAINNKVQEYLGELEGVLDDLFLGKIKEFNLAKDMQEKQLPKQAVPMVESWVKMKIKEFIEVYENKEVAETYIRTRKEIAALLKALGTFIPSLSKFSEIKKANRKPRKRKAKPAAQQIKSMKYKKSDDELKISSVIATDIVGAAQVWVYNTKTRKLAVYKTESAAGIQVKGSTLQNYEPELSSQKTLRKPKTQLTDLVNAGKVQLRKFMDNIKAKDQPVRGRMNADTLIVRVV
jgi:hypothetical protein